MDSLARFRYQLSNSPRIGQRKRLLIRNSSSHTLNIPNSSPSVNRKHTSDTTDNTANKSAQNSPSNIRRHNLKQDLKPRPRSLSDDRMNNDHTTVADDIYRRLLPSEQDQSGSNRINPDQTHIEMDELKPFIITESANI